MMTASVVDDLTETTSCKACECTGLGLTKMAASLFGGIASFGMIGQMVGNVRYGGRGRLPTLIAGVLLLIVLVPLWQWVAQVPVAALVAVTVATHDLAAGVVVGVLLSGVFFAFTVTRMMDVAIIHDRHTDTRIYTVSGQIFFC
jgi:sulfate permease, SulP family